MDVRSVDAEARDDRDKSRIEAAELDAVAILQYQPESRLVLADMHVPPSADDSAHRIPGQLLRAAIARARTEHLTLVPSFPFARRWLRDNPEEARGVAIEWPPGTAPHG